MSGGIASARRMVVTISPIVAEASRASMTAGMRFTELSRRDRNAVESGAQPRDISLAFEGFNCPGMGVPSFNLGRGDVAQQHIVLLGQLVHVDANHGDIAVLDAVLGVLHRPMEYVAEEAAGGEFLRIASCLDFIDTRANSL